MLKQLFNLQLQKAAATFAGRNPGFSNMLASLAAPKYNVTLSGASGNHIMNMKLYDVKPDEPVLDPEEQPGYYNVYDEDEFPEEEKEHHPEPDIGRKIESPLNKPSPKNEPEHKPKGPLGEEVL